MKNSIEQRIEKLEKAVFGKRKITVKDERFELAGVMWQILDTEENICLCLAERLPNDMKFDQNINDWTSSNLRNYLNTDFYRTLADEVGEENIIETFRNLLSLDGQDEYGACTDKVSIISIDNYRKYRDKIPNTGYWWWTLTPYSTKQNNDLLNMAVVSPSGIVNGGSCDDCLGVRPFVSFNSTVFESGSE